MRRTRQPETAPALPTGGAVIGYARVSTAEQSLALQIDALTKAGCDRIVSEKVSAAASRRPELERAMQLLRPGDVLVVWKLDRLARSVFELHRRLAYIAEQGASLRCVTQMIDTATPIGRLMINILATVAEFERDLIAERSQTGMRLAKQRGVRFGPRPKLTEKQIEMMQRDRNKGLSLRRLAEKYGVSMGTVQNWTTALKAGA